MTSSCSGHTWVMRIKMSWFAQKLSRQCISICGNHGKAIQLRWYHSSWWKVHCSVGKDQFFCGNPWEYWVSLMDFPVFGTHPCVSPQFPHFLCQHHPKTQPAGSSGYSQLKLQLYNWCIHFGKIVYCNEIKHSNWVCLKTGYPSTHCFIIIFPVIHGYFGGYTAFSHTLTTALFMGWISIVELNNPKIHIQNPMKSHKKNIKSHSIPISSWWNPYFWWWNPSIFWPIPILHQWRPRSSGVAARHSRNRAGHPVRRRLIPMDVMKISLV